MTAHISGTNGSNSWVIAMADDKTWAHAYADEKDALIGATTTLSSGPGVSYYDGLGHRLVPKQGELGNLAALRPTGSPDPELVRDGLQAVLRRIPDVMRSNPASVTEYLAERKITLEETVAALPRLDGCDLAAALRECRDILGPHDMARDTEHRRGFWHNLVAHGLR